MHPKSNKKGDNLIANIDIAMNQTVNPYVSVDCVLLGFDGEQLNVLVVRQSEKGGEGSTGNYKLPGSLIYVDQAKAPPYRSMTRLSATNMGKHTKIVLRTYSQRVLRYLLRYLESLSAIVEATKLSGLTLQS